MSAALLLAALTATPRMADPIPVRLWSGVGYSIQPAGHENAFGPTGVLGFDASFALGRYRHFGVGLSIELLGGLGGFGTHPHERAVTWSFGPSMSWRGEAFLWRMSLGLNPHAALSTDDSNRKFGSGRGISAGMDELYRVSPEWSVGLGARLGVILVDDRTFSEHTGESRGWASALLLVAWTPLISKDGE